MNAAELDAVLAVHRAAQAAGHGKKEAVYQDACLRLGYTRATLMRRLKEATVRPERKQRADAGDVSLPRDEAVKISAALMDSLRKNNKRLLTVAHAVSMLRANNEIRAERIDPATGECVPLSASAITRALKGYALHPDQLLRAAPHTELQSLHPNHVWQIDPLGIDVSCTFVLQVDNPIFFFNNVMKGRDNYPVIDLRQSLYDELHNVMNEIIGKKSVGDLNWDLALKKQFEVAAENHLRTTFQRSGFNPCA